MHVRFGDVSADGGVMCLGVVTYCFIGRMARDW